MVSMIFASQKCGGYNTNFFCYGYPAILQHSFVYDMVFLRGSPQLAFSEHLSSGLTLALVPVVSLIVIVVSKRKGKLNAKKINNMARMAFWLGIFFALWHELYWLAMSFAFHLYYGQFWYYKDYWSSIYYLAIIISVSVFFMHRYKRIFWRKEFFLATLAYNVFLFYWGLSNGFQITVAGGLNAPILTAFYWNFWVNFDETFSWWFIGILFVGFLIYVLFVLKIDPEIEIDETIGFPVKV